jgi:hypothetical protein
VIFKVIRSANEVLEHAPTLTIFTATDAQRLGLVVRLGCLSSLNRNQTVYRKVLNFAS